jgi:hypothetical protein
VKAVTPLLGELVAQALIGLGGERPTLFIRYRQQDFNEIHLFYELPRPRLE